MASAAPAACEHAYISMPALVGVVARASQGAPTPSPAIDDLTS
jgi:hypothetical protein